MTELADAVLPLIRTRADVGRWSSANEHGEQMNVAVDILEAAVTDGDPADVYRTTHRALASALKVIARADDSSGIIGSACRRLLDLHPVVAARAGVAKAELVRWMMDFQFHQEEVDYFALDPAAYAAALGEDGMRLYRAKLDEVATTLGPLPPAAGEWSIADSQERWALEWNARRLAVYDRDAEAIIRTHARDLRVAAWFEDTARAFEEIGDVDKAIGWADDGGAFDKGHQAKHCAEYWSELLARYRPTEYLEARRRNFSMWPDAAHAGALYAAAGPRWGEFRDEVSDALRSQPSDAVIFALDSLKDARLAWDLAHSLDLADNRLWTRVATSYEKIDRLVVLPVLARVIEAELIEANVHNYRPAARKLQRMRRLAEGSPQASDVDHFISEMRERNRRRPRLQQEFDRAQLP
jgi:hypothetical protein